MQEKDFNQTGAAVFPLTAAEAGDLAAIVERIGADPRSLRYLGPKRRVLHFFVPKVDYRAAAFVKQELLARGGDAIVARGVIDGTCKTSGVLMMGTDSQIDRLLLKLESLDCWGLPELRAALSSAVRGLRVDRWRLALPGGRSLELNRETKVMGILNLTPDSFHPASRVDGTEDLLHRAQEMLADGADVLDLGAESTRPGSLPISGQEELERLLPALRALRPFPRPSSPWTPTRGPWPARRRRRERTSSTTWAASSWTRPCCPARPLRACPTSYPTSRGVPPPCRTSRPART